jgi:hypothetical protein
MEKDNETKTIKDEDKISICELMKEDTSEIIRKLESKVPSHIQNYSNLYTEYLHGLDDLFGTCYMVEKEFFDRLDIDQGVLRQVREHSRIAKENYLDGVEMGTKFLDDYVKMRISAIKTFDDYFHTMMESYAKMLSQFNNSLKSSS